MAYKLLDDAIKVRLKQNITKQKSFQERIERTLSKYHGKFEDFETLFPQFKDVANYLSAETQREKKPQLSDGEIAFYDIILMEKELDQVDLVLVKNCEMVMIKEQISKAVRHKHPSRNLQTN